MTQSIRTFMDDFRQSGSDPNIRLGARLYHPSLAKPWKSCYNPIAQGRVRHKIRCCGFYGRLVGIGRISLL